MAPQLSDADFQILASCIKNSPSKLNPNFEEVAKDCGLKDGKAAYMRHWSIMKKLGLTGTRPQRRKQREAAAALKKRVVADEEIANGDDEGVDDEVLAGPESQKYEDDDELRNNW